MCDLASDRQFWYRYLKFSLNCLPVLQFSSALFRIVNYLILEILKLYKSVWFFFSKVDLCFQLSKSNWNERSVMTEVLLYSATNGEAEQFGQLVQ